MVLALNALAGCRAGFSASVLLYATSCGLFSITDPGDSIVFDGVVPSLLYILLVYN